MEKQPMPVARCTRCGEVAYAATVINTTHRCDKKQRGTWGSTIGVDDWKECEACQGTGRQNAQRCERCGGIGWHFLRKRI